LKFFCPFFSFGFQKMFALARVGTGLRAAAAAPSAMHAVAIAAQQRTLRSTAPARGILKGIE
jgi:hypothetical protein